MDNDINKANSLLDAWFRKLFYTPLGEYNSDKIDAIVVSTRDGFNVRTIVLKNGDEIRVTVDYRTSE